MKEQIKKALDIKDRAFDERNGEDTTEALRLIDDAIALLRRLWEQKKKVIDDPEADPGPDERDLIEALAEAYGVKGGILRSSGKPGQAAAAYREGKYFEQHRARRVENSYNLVQHLTNLMLSEPRRAGAPEWTVGGTNMWQELDEARVVLQRQLTTGGRGNDPWAAADMLTVQLLLAPRNPNGARATKEAYAEFEKLMPEAGVYKSTLRAFEDLKAGLEGVPEGERSENLNVLLSQLGVITAWLRDGFEEAKKR